MTYFSDVDLSILVVVISLQKALLQFRKHGIRDDLRKLKKRWFEIELLKTKIFWISPSLFNLSSILDKTIARLQQRKEGWIAEKWHKRLYNRNSIFFLTRVLCISYRKQPLIQFYQNSTYKLFELYCIKSATYLVWWGKTLQYFRAFVFTYFGTTFRGVDGSHKFS